jgi:hypothetical protein
MKRGIISIAAVVLVLGTAQTARGFLQKSRHEVARTRSFFRRGFTRDLNSFLFRFGRRRTDTASVKTVGYPHHSPRYSTSYKDSKDIVRSSILNILCEITYK